MKREFISNIGYLIFLNLLVKPFWILGIDRSVQNLVGPAEYGIYFSIFNFAYLFQVVLDFGINNFNNRHIAQQPGRLQQYFFSTFLVKCLFTVAYSILVFVVAFGIQFNQYQIQILLLMVCMQIVMSFYSFLRSNVAALHLFKTDAVLSVLDKFIAILICAFLLWSGQSKYVMNIENYIYAQIIASILVCFAGIYVIIRKTPIQIVFKRELVFEVIQKAFPFALLTFLMTVYYRIDAVMIERMLGENGNLEAGIYASGYRLLDACNVLGILFAAVLLPMFSRMIENKNNVQPLVDVTHNIMLVASVPFGIACIIFRNEIMQTLYTGANAYYGEIFGWLMVSFICISMIYIYGTLLTSNGNLRILNQMALFGMLLNILLNFFFIQYFAALGAAIATVITQVIILFLHLFFSYKLLGLRFYLKKWGRSFFFIVITISTIYGISLLPLSLFFSIFLSMLTGIILALLLRMFSLRDVKNTFLIYLNRG
ncbi:MAG: oligosaccharide flippase family protein [Chitinophagales bacterium]